MICISTTSNSKDILKKIASKVLKENLSPCTHITQISESNYIWKDEIVEEVEFKLDIKTVESHQKQVTSIIKELHNYEVFELTLNQINSINQKYNDWFNQQIK